jgi:GTPase SAR1 family protein
MKYTKGEFRQDYNVTIGVEFASKTITIDEESPPLTLQIWDTVSC